MIRRCQKIFKVVCESVLTIQKAKIQVLNTSGVVCSPLKKNAYAMKKKVTKEKLKYNVNITGSLLRAL